VVGEVKRRKDRDSFSPEGCRGEKLQVAAKRDTGEVYRLF
jgi:hypothetical protein